MVKLPDDPWFSKEEHAEVVTRWLAENSSHPHDGLSAQFSYTAMSDEYVLSIVCHACEHVWDSGVSTVRLYASAAPPARIMVVRDWIAPILRRAAAVACFRMTMMAELAEWITERCARAGEAGVTYAALLEEAAKDRLCAPSDVDVVLEKLGFIRNWHPGHFYVVEGDKQRVRMVGSELVPEGPTITLPKDHPMHPGNSHNCDLDINWEDWYAA